MRRLGSRHWAEDDTVSPYDLIFQPSDNASERHCSPERLGLEHRNALGEVTQQCESPFPRAQTLLAKHCFPTELTLCTSIVSHYIQKPVPNSLRRTKALADKGILFVGTGVPGGEEGACKGPSIMPGGNPAAWPHVKEIFQAISTKMDEGTPCCD